MLKSWWPNSCKQTEIWSTLFTMTLSFESLGGYQKEQAVQGRDSCWYKGADRADSESSFYVVTIYCYPTQDFLQILKKGGKYITL